MCTSLPWQKKQAKRLRAHNPKFAFGEVFITQSDFNLLALDFLRLLFADLEQKQIVLPAHWDIDHLCYRTSSLTQYEELKTTFSGFAKLLIESDVNGRPIATYKLHQAIHFKEWLIDVVELPAPKASKPTPAGFEHIEVVCDVPFAYFEKQYSHLNLKMDGLKKDFNQEFEIFLGERNLKFHHLSLESVINLEKSAAYAALQSSGILRDFKTYRPLVAGTIPLAVNLPSSDLDILMTAQNLNEAQELLTKAFSKENDFSATRTNIADIDSLIVNFCHGGIAFEVFVQNGESVQQTAYRHFQVEELLLKLKGETFREHIMKLRREGLKTEPAFAQALGLTGDAYLSLLKLQGLGTAELLRL